MEEFFLLIFFWKTLSRLKSKMIGMERRHPKAIFKGSRAKLGFSALSSSAEVTRVIPSSVWEWSLI